ncbi:MAG: DUF4097 family beta strand repeat-containing protein [Oleiharenicola lentus]
MKTLLTLLATSVLTVAAFAAVTENFSQTYPLAANGSIHLDNVNGYVEIIAWDKAEVSLEAVKKAKDADALSHLHLKIDSTSNRLTIKTEYEKKWKFWDNARAEVRYKLMVPAGVSLDKIDVVNCGIRVTGVKGSVNLDSVNGSIEAEGLGGAGRFDTVNGSISVAYAVMPDSADSISLDTVNGSCTLKLPAGAGFKLDADTVNGHVSCDFPITLEKSGRHTLRGSVASGANKVKLDSVNGGLTVAKLN